jgi:O-antigen/teichoic acid export membrane protein
VADADTMRAAGLAAATMASNLVGLLFTLVFTRLLGADGYGSLAALVNLTVILFVPGSALQVAATRAATLARLGTSGELAAAERALTRRLLIGVAAVTVAAVLAREPLAALLNVDQAWAAAAVPVSAALWTLLGVQRGLLQAARAYRLVGISVVAESAGRLLAGVLLVSAGLDVTGAYLGTAISLAAAAAVLGAVLRRQLGAPDPARPVRSLVPLLRGARLPIAALTLVALLQNLDVIVARHQLPEDPAGVYAAATVAAKAVVWIAIGIGLWLLPEAVHRAAAGTDPRPVLRRAFALIAAVAVPALLAYAVVPRLVLRIAFGPEYASGEGILLTLGLAYAILALTYLSVQFLLGLHRRGVLGILGIAAVAEAALLAGLDSPESFAGAVLLVQAVAGAATVGLALTARSA